MFNDLKASRFNSRKYRENIVTEELWKEWKEKTGRTESFKEFRDVWHKIATNIVDNIVEERDGIRLPKGIGDMYLGFLPGSKKQFIDYQESLKYGKHIWHENWDTNQKAGKIIYGTRHRKYLHKLAGWWAFTACRNFKKRAVQAFKDNPTRYKNSIERRK